MNFHIARPAPAPQPRQKIKPVPRKLLKMAKAFLMPYRPHDRMPDHLYRMLNILYHFEGMPENMVCDGCNALVFNQNSKTEQQPEYPILFLNKSGHYVVYSVMEVAPDEPGWVYCIETMTTTGWSEEWYHRT